MTVEPAVACCAGVDDVKAVSAPVTGMRTSAEVETPVKLVSPAYAAEK